LTRGDEKRRKMTSLHLVIPGQVIASASTQSANEEDSFLRGHGTYLERVDGKTGPEQRLVASVCGVVQRVNKLITVVPTASTLYTGHVGDLVVGRVTSVGTSRWRVSLTGHSRDAQLPLTGVHLPGGAQRIRTAQDQRDMRQFFQEGDLVSAEVHNIQQDGTLVLHTRSTRYGKLENGCLVTVPPALVPRRKNHYITDILNVVDVLFGTNGNIWIQRKMSSLESAKKSSDDNSTERGSIMNEVQEKIRHEHATSPIMIEDRLAIARIRNSIECLRLVHAMITPESVEAVYKESEAQQIRPADMMHPDTVLRLTASRRKG
jgi:exosome complex component RRP4